jgi:uncharacterized protein involved in response to NO
MNKVLSEPYRIFFPIGLAYGFWGVALWVLYGLHLTSFYPGPLHTHLMIGGFLGSFAFGFLMTAVPRFTASFPATFPETLWTALPLIVTLPLSLFGQPLLVLMPLLLSFLGMAYFVGRRWFKGGSRPADPFILVGFSLGSAILGLVLLIASTLVPLGRLLFLHAFMLLLIAGVGSQLVPMLLGSASPGGCMRSTRGTHNKFIYIGGILVLSFVIEALVSEWAGRLIQAVILSLILIKHWGIHHLPGSRSKLSWLLWTACWFLLLGKWGAVAFPGYYIHFMHLTFVGGLALMTLMVATRVVLAHGGFNLILESQLSSLFWSGGCILLASLTRMSAGFVPAIYSRHLLYAAMMWIAGLAIWSSVFGIKIIFTRTQIR